MQKSGYFLHCASESFKNDKDVILTAVRRNPASLEFASKTCKNHKDMVLAAVQQNAHSVQ